MPRLDRASLTAGIVGLLARQTPWLEPELTGLAELVKPGDVCVDVGAAAGLYTVMLSELAGSTGHVHSIEPLRFAHALWTRLLRAGESGNVTHYPMALGTEPGEARMSVPIGKYGLVTGRSFLEFKTDGVGSNAEFEGQVEVIVEVDTLDQLATRIGLSRLDFVKIDVEGGELNVLRGGQQVIERYRPTMLIEIEERHITRYQHSAGDVVDWLLARGYEMSVWQDGWRPTGGMRPDIRNYLFRAHQAR